MRRARAAIFTVTVRSDGAAYGTAANGGVLGAHLSPAGLVGALAYAGLVPTAFAEPAFPQAPLFVDGMRVPYAPDRVAEALAGTWWRIVTAARVVGATTGFIGQDLDLGVRAGTRLIDLSGDL